MSFYLLQTELLSRAYDVLDNALYPRWGSGKYVIDDHTYHRDVKPKILSHFNGMKGFSSKCGSNPDFMVERDGTVYPSSRTDKKGLCSKVYILSRVVFVQPVLDLSINRKPSVRTCMTFSADMSHDLGRLLRLGTKTHVLTGSGQSY